ncbi:unnamed protein product, partial [Rhizoctonia solani]
ARMDHSHITPSLDPGDFPNPLFTESIRAPNPHCIASAHPPPSRFPASRILTHVTCESFISGCRRRAAARLPTVVSVDGNQTGISRAELYEFEFEPFRYKRMNRLEHIYGYMYAPRGSCYKSSQVGEKNAPIGNK